MTILALPSRVFDKIQPEPTSGCWLWTAAISQSGYGVCWWSHESSHAAHRVVYAALVGPVPAGLDLDHLCRVRSCVNPAHLEPVTRRVNLLRGDTLPARQVAQTHCLRGHAFDSKNTWISKTGKRWCRMCHRDRARRYRAQKTNALLKTAA